MFKIIEKVATVFEIKRTSGLEQYINSKNPQSAADVEQLTREYQDNNTTYWGRGL
jgi:hypothetical protein